MSPRRVSPLLLRRLWRSLATIPSHRAVRSEWQSELGEEWDRCADLFTPTDSLAMSWPDAWGHRHEVIHHGGNDWVAVCPESGQRRKLTREEIRVWEFNVPRCIDRLRAAWGITPSGRQPPFQTSCHFLGTDVVSRRFAFFCVPTWDRIGRTDGEPNPVLPQPPSWFFIPTATMIPAWLLHASHLFGHELFVLEDRLRVMVHGAWRPVLPRKSPTPVLAHQTIPQVSDHGLAILQAMYSMKLNQRDLRKKALAIVYRAFGNEENPDSYKREFAKLVRQGLCYSVRASQQSGYWLSDSGLSYLKGRSRRRPR